MQPRNRSLDGKSASNKAANKSAPLTTDEDKEKKKLLKDIQQLRNIIEQIEWNIEILRFKDAECRIEPRDTQISHFSRIPNGEVQLQNDLYKFSGLRCVKFKKSEAIFNFTSANEQQKDNTYGVQILINEKSSLGKWVMPMSVDMNEILTKIPIDKPKNLTVFIKNCKHSINCYTVRQEQFLSLKERTLCMKHCALHHNIGYMQITLEIYGVHDKEDDKYINLIIYLLYHFDEARPYKIKIDTTTKNKLNDETRQKWKIYLKEFKMSDLQTAFNQVFMKKNSLFTWTQGDDSESPLEINDTSTSGEENFLEQLQSERSKSLRKAKRKRKLQEKWSKRMKQSIMKNIESSEDDNNDNVHSKVEVSQIKSLSRAPTKKRKIASPSKQQKQTNKSLLEATPMNKPKIKLKQTKLDFQATEPTNSDNVNKKSLIQSESHTKPNSKNKKLAQLVTSTPLPPRVRSKVMISTLEIDNITEIGSPLEKVVNNSKLKNSSPLKDTNTPKQKIQRKLGRRLRRSKRQL